MLESVLRETRPERGDNRTMSTRASSCAGCRGVIGEDSDIMRCNQCKQSFDIFCANFTGEIYATLSTEFKNSWICIECRSKIPKGDNTGTPVRQTYLPHDMSITSDGPDVSLCSVDNVTVRTGTRYAPATRQTDTMNKALDTMRTSMIQEFKQLHTEFESRMTAKMNKFFNECFKSLKFEIYNRFNDLSSKIEELDKKMHSMTHINTMKTNDQVKIDVVKNKPDSGTDVNRAKTDEHVEASLVTLPEHQYTTVLVSPVQSQIPVSNHLPLNKSRVDSRKSNSLSNSSQSQQSVSLIKEKISDSEGTREWTEARRKRQRTSVLTSSVLRGTAVPGVTGLQASERWKYLHLFYVRQGTQVDQVLVHLKSICNEAVCTVEALKSRGNYASFKIGTPSRLVEAILEPRNWTADICIKPWRQNFRQNFRKDKEAERFKQN